MKKTVCFLLSFLTFCFIFTGCNPETGPRAGGARAGQPSAKESNVLNLPTRPQYPVREAGAAVIDQTYRHFNNVAVSGLYAGCRGLGRAPRAAGGFQIPVSRARPGRSNFTDDPDIALKTDHAITDYILVLPYPANAHPVLLAPAVTQGLYFTAGPGEVPLPRQSARDAFIKTGAEDSLGFSTPVKDIFKEYRQNQLLSYLIYIAAVILAALALFLTAVLLKRRMKNKPSFPRGDKNSPF